MTRSTHLPAAVPKGCIEIKAHSSFGSQIGYTHYVLEDETDTGVYYIGLELEEKHAGAPGRGHGGVTMSVLDEVMGRAASRQVGKLCYTASMTTNFCAASKVGEFLLGTATIARSGRTMVFVDAQLHSGDTLIATATGSFINSGQDIPFQAKQGE